MKIDKLIFTEEQILSSPMMEMANLAPSRTGLPVVIWFGEVGGQHGPRIKVSNIRGKFAANDNFVVSVDKEPRLLTPRAMKLKKEEFDDISDWIKINYDSLMLMWKAYESGEDATDVILQLKKL
jgi:hypothetical protein